MTARYDGILMTSVRGKEVVACCRSMDEAAMRGQFYVSTKGALMLRRNDKTNAGSPCVCCPFCGARLGATPVTIYTDSPQYAQLCEQAERGEGPLAVPKEGEV